MFYAAGAPEAHSAPARGSRSSAAATPPARQRSGSPAGARSSPSSTAAPTSARRCPTTLIHDLERYGVAIHDGSEIAALHGEEGHLEAVTLMSGERLPFAFMFLFLGALPCTEWLDDTVGRDHDGFILTGAAANMDNLLETGIPGVFAAGDVRSGSTKRCATAVGEGAMAVQLIHAHLSRTPAVEDRRERRCLHPSGPDRRSRAAGVGRGLRGLPADGRQVAAPPHLPDLRPCRVLRRLAQPARHGARPRHVAPDHPITGARRGLELVLRRRRRVPHRRDPRPDPHPPVTAPAVTGSACDARRPRGFQAFIAEAGGEVRTPDLPLTRRLLWPTELRRHASNVALRDAPRARAPAARSWPEPVTSCVTSGLRTVVLERPGPVVALRLTVATGARDDHVAGATHMLEHLLFRTREGAEARHAVEAAGGEMGATTTREQLSIDVVVLPADLELAFAALGRVLGAVPSPTDLARERPSCCGRSRTRVRSGG